jgi:hypothetical protein
MPRAARLARTAFASLSLAAAAFAQPPDTQLRPATPLDPVAAILDAFATHDVVAMSDGAAHGHQQGHELIVRLLADAELGRRIDDIVVEWGNSLYQDVIDRYTAGEDVPRTELKQVWQNTTHELMWDPPIYEEFFRAVRLINARLPRDEHLRVLLGDPPIDWATITTEDDREPFFAQRDSFPAKLIEDEVIARGRRALVIYGGLHLIGRPLPRLSDGIVIRLRAAGVKVFNIASFTRDVAAAAQADVASWDTPQLALVAGTPLGSAQAGSIPVPTESLWDAVMIYEPRSAVQFSHVSPAVCVDTEYLELLRKRLPSLTLEDMGIGHCDR